MPHLVLALSLLLTQPPDPAIVGRPAAEEFAAGRFAELSARFNEKMKAAATDTVLQQTHARLTQQLGAYKTFAGATQCSPAGFGLHSCLTPLLFERGRLALRISVSADGRVAGFRLAGIEPPEGLAPDANTSVVSGAVTLPAVLTLPKTGTGPFPLIVLVHGSGAHDADETIGPNKPFRDLAEGLASRGIATLRYVKRNRLAPLPPNSTLDDEVTTDALAAVALARRTTGVDPSRVFVLGHSLGGYMAPHIASRDPAIRGIIVMAGNTRSMRESLIDQVQHLTGSLDALDQAIASLPVHYRNLLPGYDPTTVALGLRRPVLVLQGGRDYQVNNKDFQRWTTALEGTPDGTLKVYPRLNHLFLEGDGKSMPTEYNTPGTIPAQVLDDIATWIRGVQGKQ